MIYKAEYFITFQDRPRTLLSRNTIARVKIHTRVKEIIMSIPLSSSNITQSKRKTIGRRISVAYAQNKPKAFNKVVGRNSDDLGRIYLPGSCIGKTVKVSLVE